MHIHPDIEPAACQPASQKTTMHPIKKRGCEINDCPQAVVEYTYLRGGGKYQDPIRTKYLYRVIHMYQHQTKIKCFSTGAIAQEHKWLLPIDVHRPRNSIPVAPVTEEEAAICN